jgi:hypothetical protein
VDAELLRPMSVTFRYKLRPDGTPEADNLHGVFALVRAAEAARWEALKALGAAERAMWSGGARSEETQAAVRVATERRDAALKAITVAAQAVRARGGRIDAPRRNKIGTRSRVRRR